jgi:stearoyl-CoA desaturase (delta-9 desaturase)
MLKDLIFRSGFFRIYIPVMLLAFYVLSLQQIAIGLFLGWLITGIGVSVVLHRYVSHRSFEFKNKTYKFISYLIAFMSGFGNPVVWASIHRQHHMSTDTKGDPQSPLQIGKLRTFLSMFEVPHNQQIDKQKEILLDDKFNNFYTRHYFILMLLYFASLYVLFGVDAFLIMVGIVIPTCISIQGYVNAFLHSDRIDEDGLYSKNIKGSLFLFGENLHKEHHKKPNKPWHSKWDLGKYYIQLVGIPR